jgi:hypothetical protein
VTAVHILILSLACLLSVSCSGEERVPLTKESALVAPLIDPAKLATLGDRGANPRIQKAVAIMWGAKQAGTDPVKVAADAVTRIGWSGTEKGTLTADALVRNLTIAERLGAVTPVDIEAMKRGRAPTVRNGPYVGDIVSVDHIIPRSVAPELDNVIANLEFMPLKMNRSKNDKVSERQLSLARKLHAAGLMTDAGFQRVAAASIR